MLNTLLTYHLLNLSTSQLFPLLLAKCLIMNKKWVPFLLILVLAVVLFFVKQYKGADTSKPTKDATTNNSKNQGSDINRNRGFDRRVSYLEYSEHAKCRMQCRKISQTEVEEIMKEGKINYSKTDVDDRPCPTYALEGLGARCDVVQTHAMAAFRQGIPQFYGPALRRPDCRAHAACKPGKNTASRVIVIA